MELILRRKELWKYVNGTFVEPYANDTSEMELHQHKKDKAFSLIIMSGKEECESSVLTLREPISVWAKLRNIYQTVFEASIDARMIQLQNIEMLETETITQYSNKISNLVSELAAIGHGIAKSEKKRHLLRGLLDDFAVTAQRR